MGWPNQRVSDWNPIVIPEPARLVAEERLDQGG